MMRFKVAAGILRDTDGRVLIAERLGGGPFHGMWEFPGGKIASNESAEQALARKTGARALRSIVEESNRSRCQSRDLRRRSVRRTEL